MKMVYLSWVLLTSCPKPGYWDNIQARRAPFSLDVQGHPTLEIPTKAITGEIKLEFEIDEDMPVKLKIIPRISLKGSQIAHVSSAVYEFLKRFLHQDF